MSSREIAEQRTAYILPQDLSKLESAKSSIEMSEAQMHACHQVARLSYGLLSNNVSVNVGSFRERFLGFASGKTLGVVDIRTRRDLEAAIHGYFGDDFLKWAGMGAMQSGGVGRRLFGDSSSNSSLPVNTVILTACGEAMVGDSVIAREPERLPVPIIYCVNEDADHGPRHPVDRLRRRGGRYFAASCSCGMRFRFVEYSGQSAIDPQPSKKGWPKRKYPNRYQGGRYQGGGKVRSSLGQAVVALRAQGKSRQEVATSLNLDLKRVRNFERVRAKS
jgi:hypothetical protein